MTKFFEAVGKPYCYSAALLIRVSVLFSPCQLFNKESFREPQKNKVPAGPLPNPSPKFGRGTPEAGLMSPFSQAWEKGLGDEGLGTLFTRGSLIDTEKSYSDDETGA